MRRNENLVDAYLERLDEEAQALFKDFPSQLDTIYFGGGTPSHLSDSELACIVKTFEQTWGWPARLETTLEADPLTFDKARLENFKSMGFSRLSIGLQSTQDSVLQFLGRRHNGREGLQAINWALEAGFEVSADVITGMAMQDAAKDLHAVAKTGVPHISVYSLTIEPYTPFALRKITPNEEKEAQDYDLAHSILKTYGLERYEVSSHAKRGHESKHNQVYWQGEYFLALGPSAAGFLPKKGYLGERRTNPSIKAWLNHEPPETLNSTAEDYLLDVLMTGLRTQKGVSLAKLESKTGIKLLERYKPLLNEFFKLELLSLENGTLRATDGGLLQLNGILKRFFAYL